IRGELSVGPQHQARDGRIPAGPARPGAEHRPGPMSQLLLVLPAASLRPWAPTRAAEAVSASDGQAENWGRPLGGADSLLDRHGGRSSVPLRTHRGPDTKEGQNPVGHYRLPRPAVSSTAARGPDMEKLAALSGEVVTIAVDPARGRVVSCTSDCDAAVLEHG